jgi:hypothetical protein
VKLPRSIRLSLAGIAAIAVLSGCGGNGNPVAPSSQLDTTPPPAPQDLTLDSDARGNPIMSWTASAAPDVAGYQVYEYKPVSGGYDYVATGGVTTNNSFALPTLSTSVEVSYRVRAVDVAGNWSTYSSTADITIPVRNPDGDYETK